MEKGFRQNHPTRGDLGHCVVTFVHPTSKQRVYAHLNGLPFGLGAVVNQFNRLPLLLTALCRRVSLLVASHYFDDTLHLELEQLAGAGAALVRMRVRQASASDQEMCVPPRPRP